MSTDLTKQPKTETIKSLLVDPYFKQQVALALPRHLTPDRFIRAGLTALMRSPKLMQCTKPSFLNCMMQLSQFGLEPDGRRAHLIPFENRKTGTVECTLIIDWKGLAELALRSGTISKLHADLVCDADEFSYDMGEITAHKINFRMPRGEPYAAYAMAVTKTGEKFVQVMTRDEIEAIRDNSQGYKAFKNGYTKQSPWQDSPGEMWKKTVFRRLSKWLPLSPELRDAVEADDDEQRPMVQAKTPEMMQLPESVDDDQVPGAEYPAQEATQQAPQQAAGPSAMSHAQTALKEACEQHEVDFCKMMDVLFPGKSDSMTGWSDVPERVAAGLTSDVKSLVSAIKKAKV